MWRKRKSKKRFSGNWTKIYWVIPILFVSSLVFVVFKWGLLNITQVEISNSQLECTDETQIRNSTNIIGHNVFLINFENIKKNLKAKFICIRNVDLSLVFPNKIKIKISGRQPVATLMLLQNKEASSSSILENIATPSAKESQDAYLIDSEGVIFYKSTGRFNIPNIFIKDVNLSLGKEPEGDNTKNSLKILDKVKTFGLDVKTSVVLDNFFIIFSYPRVIFLLDDRVDVQIASLKLILAEAKIDLKELEFIDLRFDKPIVKFAPKK